MRYCFMNGMTCRRGRRTGSRRVGLYPVEKTNQRVQKANNHWISCNWWLVFSVVTVFPFHIITHTTKKTKNILPQYLVWISGPFLFSIRTKTNENANWCYEQLRRRPGARRMPVTWLSTDARGAKHNQQCGLISMCWPSHMSIKVGNSSGWTNTWQDVDWHPFLLLTYRTSRHSLWGLRRLIARCAQLRLTFFLVCFFFFSPLFSFCFGLMLMEIVLETETQNT